LVYRKRCWHDKHPSQIPKDHPQLVEFQSMCAALPSEEFSKEITREQEMSPSSSFIGGKPLQPRGEAWRLSQRSLVDESSP